MRFDYFVILAGMRTGSNFLEANLNEYPGLMCHGELFNPHFIGHAKRDSLFGVTLDAREADPMALIRRVREKTDGLAGFRLFHDHDPRVLEAALADPRAAKIVLSRNPLDSFISLKIAGQTGQWRLGDLRHAKSARVAFDRQEFSSYLDRSRAYQDRLVRQLQRSGQTAFFLTYEDVGDVEVMNGLAAWLGVTAARKATSSRTKKQNPETLDEKVTNYPEMIAALAEVDHFDLGRYPVFEPRRGPAVPQHVAAARAPLLFMPIRSGPVAAVSGWLAALDGVEDSGLQRGFTQKTLRKWMRENTGHRSFTVLRHPVRRLHDAFCRHILSDGPETFREIRQTLKQTYRLPLPDKARDAAYTVADHRRAFAEFARFIQGNLAGQSSIRVDAAWASQVAVVQGMAQFSPPDHILREDALAEALPRLAAEIGREAPEWRPLADPAPYALEEIYDREIESLVANAYQRDYMMFGFGPLQPG
ncbi:nodulation protein NodH [Frigidibacter sp. ROC022]|uniref:nodulation protein NodH n=1 Tax=Frigidibacter sp. ROC022 TaxID=2971796 RepID=UPI00215AC9BF|nr:nodulation protein NodH [Frigidibacter sp. ROC022]MCR8724411.1 nodulation protein NodH [Frigidibacter sp. ROC022]